MDSPIVLIIYHKPERTRKIIDVLRGVKPKKIFVIADGPKNELDYKECTKTRAQVDKIDWDCEVVRKFSDKNIGLRKNIVGGLNWVFGITDRAIILEDDLNLDPSFFKFCDEMLEKYKNDGRVISVSGNNFLFGKVQISESYYFSRYVHSWGWATWRRAWLLYDDSMSDWKNLKRLNYLNTYLKSRVLCLYWKIIFDLVNSRRIDSWAYVWTYTAFKNQKLTIIPSKNLVSNSGYGRSATHTMFKVKTMGMKVDKMNFPLKHPKIVAENLKADEITEKNIYLRLSVISSMLLKLIINK